MTERTLFPDNFHLIHEGEETIRATSIEAIEANADLVLHCDVIEAAISLMRHYVLRDDHRDQDDLHIRLLGIRTTNGLTSALQTLLSGYYQPSAQLQRDLIETSFLLDYLSIDRSLIKVWREANDKTLDQKFKPFAVRVALDEHYGHTEKKRAAEYKLFSQLASHPTPKGFAMIRRPDGTHECGPFFDETALIATLSELGKRAVGSAEIFERFFNRSTRLDYETQFAFYVPKLRWMEKFWGVPVDEAQLKGIRQAISRVAP